MIEQLGLLALVLLRRTEVSDRDPVTAHHFRLLPTQGIAFRDGLLFEER